MAREGRSNIPVSGHVVIGALVCGLAFAMASTAASANPIIGPDFWDKGELLSYLAVTNLPIDLFCFSALTLVMCKAQGDKVGKVAKRPIYFVASVVLASLVIAASGVAIDFYSFYASDGHGYSLWWGNDDPVYMSLNLYLALVSIFLSVFLVGAVVVRMNPINSLYTATGMTAVNLAAWMIIITFSGSFDMILPVLVSSVFWFLSFGPLYLLWKWSSKHEKEDAQESGHSALSHSSRIN